MKSNHIPETVLPDSLMAVGAHTPLEPLPGDPWIVSSALHKAIRRGEAEIAERAALSYLLQRGNGIFRRLLVIAYEDVGIAAPDLLVAVTRLCTNARARKHLADTPNLVRSIVRALAAAPKDRSADYLVNSAIHRADWERYREEAGRRDVKDRIALATGSASPLAARAAATWFASGLEDGSEKRIGPGDIDGLMRGFIEAGLPMELMRAVQAAAKVTREPIVLMLPLLVQEIARNQGQPTEERVVVSPARFANGIPLFALDKHTRAGRQAITSFARENAAVRESLERHVPEFRHRDAAMLAAFYADAVPISLRLNWDRADELEALGIDTDLRWAGIAPDGMSDVLGVVRSNLDHLNEARAQVLRGAVETGGRS